MSLDLNSIENLCGQLKSSSGEKEKLVRLERKYNKK